METDETVIEAAPVPEFEAYGLPHLVVLGFTLLAAVVLVWTARRDRAHPWLKWKERLLVAALFLTYPAKLLVLLTDGASSMDFRLPLHLCDLTAYVAMLALVWRNQRLAELAYFWGIAGTLQGLLTPAVGAGYPYPEFFRFFLLHSAVVVAAVYLPVGKRLVPEEGAVWRAFGWMQVYVVAAALANLATGANYGFLCEPPPTASLIDLLGEWPYYIVWMEVIALLFFGLLYLPWFLLGRKR